MHALHSANRRRNRDTELSQPKSGSSWSRKTVLRGCNDSHTMRQPPRNRYQPLALSPFFLFRPPPIRSFRVVWVTTHRGVFFCCFCFDLSEGLDRTRTRRSEDDPLEHLLLLRFTPQKKKNSNKFGNPDRSSQKLLPKTSDRFVEDFLFLVRQKFWAKPTHFCVRPSVSNQGSRRHAFLTLYRPYIFCGFNKKHQ